MNSSNSKFITILNNANIEIMDDIRTGEIITLDISKGHNEVSSTLSIKLDKVIDVNREKEIRTKLKDYMISNLNFNSFSLEINYVDNSIDKDMLEKYYTYIQNALQVRKARYGLLSTFKKNFSDNEIKFYVGSDTDKEIVEDLLIEVRKAFRAYGLNVNISAEISPFEITLKTQVDKKQEQVTIDVLKRQEYYENLNTNPALKEKKQSVKKPRASTPINGKITPLNKIPSTEVEVIEYNQQNGNTEFVVLGEIVECEIKEIVARATGISYSIYQGVLSDGTSSITIKTFLNKKDPNIEKFYRENASVGNNVRIFGNVQYDNYLRDVALNIITIQQEGKAIHETGIKASDYKRVELHAHTKMSTMDSVLEVEEYVKRASEYGYSALAVTDHYNIHVLPDFLSACKTYNIKPIFGVEANLVDEEKFKIALNDADINLGDATYVVYDIETTGLSSNYNEIIEISAYKVQYGQIIGEFNEFVKPTAKISEFITKLTSITNDDVRNAEPVSKVLPRFREFFKDSILVAHNATFDCSYIYANLKRLGMYEGDYPTIDTLQLARVCYGNKLKRFDLNAVSKFFDVELTQHHRANCDALATAQFFIKMLNDLLDKNIRNYNEINTLIDVEEAYKLAHPSHFCILSKNQVGKKNLYKIISDSHTTHFHRQPRVLKKFLEEHREGLLIGSGCVNGDVFTTAYEKSYEELLEVMKFYDYIEVQPIDLYDVLITDESERKQQREDIKETIKTIIKAAKELGKIVVATGDIHHLDEADKKYREIYIQAPMIGGGRHPLVDLANVPSFHFRNTEEMVAGLSFLGEDEAIKLVVDNTIEIANQIDEYELFPKELFAPKDDFLADRGIPSVAKETEEMTYNRAKEIYGDPLPKFVEDRIKKELDSIIGHKFATIYYIAYMLVKYSTDAGYIVGSRGSVGSSLVAYMMKITEVNGLPPHYYCPKCHFNAFKLTEDEKIKYPLDENQIKFDKILQSKGTGFDLPEAYCPICGEKLSRNGVDIPFETFLGFDGTKTPDIDLNFSGDFQAQAHEFCRTVFGSERAFRAGTIGTIAEKTAIGYVKGYFERTNQQCRQTELKRLGAKIEGVKRSTGQHPGGIVVIPKEIEYSDIIPIQYPADDINANWRTTHFDYHKFEHNLLKLDILGHDDPTMIRHLMNFVEAYPDEFPFKTVDEIPLTDPEVFKLFNGLDSLGLTPEQTFNQTIGTTGIPEFGTMLAKDMLSEIRPTSVDNLLKISGLSHGTGVWKGNARDFMLGLKEGFDKIPFDELIGCRDDIMVYLLSKNLPAIDSFKIMEGVRKGKGVSPKQEAEMKEYNVPDWYIESCKLIEYMFPKAHATAYVIMALRIGWFKVHRPIFYYAGFFSRRADAFDVEAMAGGYEMIRAKLNELKQRKDNKTASTKEEDTYDTLLLALEMTARGYTFKQMDINESEAINFKVSDDRKSLLIPFGALDSLGESIAKSIVEARNVNRFTSKRDVLKRSKLNNTQFERMNQMGVFGELPEDDQIGLF